MDILTNPIVVLLLGALALPGVTSIAVSLLRKAETLYGINPRVLVYGASLIVTGIAVFFANGAFPSWSGEPVAFVGAWLAWTTVNAEIARRLYEALVESLDV